MASKPDLAKFEILKQAIRKNAAMMDMNYWHGKKSCNRDNDTECRTTCCIAGMYDILYVPNWEKLEPQEAGIRAAEGLGLAYSIFSSSSGKRIIGIECDAARLFYEARWPNRERYRFDFVKTPEQIAEVICDRIDNFLAELEANEELEKAEIQKIYEELNG